LGFGAAHTGSTGSTGAVAGIRASRVADWRWELALDGSRWTARDAALSGNVFRRRLDIEAAWQLGATRLRLRGIGAAVSAGAVPEQDLVRFGGPESGPGYAFHRSAARAGWSQRVELQRRIPFLPLELGRFGRVPGTLVLAPYAHDVWVERG